MHLGWRPRILLELRLSAPRVFDSVFPISASGPGFFGVPSLSTGPPLGPGPCRSVNMSHSRQRLSGSRVTDARRAATMRTMKKNWLPPFINLGHFLDHLAMLVFPTVGLGLAREWDRSYSELLPLTVGGFIAFGAFALPAGWLADHWSRYKMMLVFFFGIGAALFLTGFAVSPWHMRVGLTTISHV